MKKVTKCCGEEETEEFNNEFPFCPCCKEPCTFENVEQFDDPFETDQDGFITKEYEQE